MYLMETFLDMNGFSVDCSDDELADLALEIDLGNIDIPKLTEWIDERIRGV